MGGMAYRRVRGQCVDHDDVVKRDEHDIKFESGPGAGIWQSGSPPVVDSNGDIFVSTGNGVVPSTPERGNNTSIKNFGEAVVELHTNTSGYLQVVDWFIAADATQLNAQDGDLGSGGPVALPASMGTANEPNVMLVLASKEFCIP